jgi:outer membrane protein assembly factor BamB
MKLRALLLISFATCFGSPLWAAVPEWPRFRGPNGSGIASGLNLPEKPGEADVNWRAELPGEGHSSPVIANQRVFLTCAEKSSGERTLVAVDAKDGAIAWKREFTGPVFRQHADNSFAAATPAVDAERVYLLSLSPEGSWLAAFAQADGKELWKKELGNFISQHGPGVSPVVWQDLVIVDFDQDQPKSFVAAFDTKTGAEKWRWEKAGGRHSSSTPCIFEPRNGPAQVVTISSAVGMSGLEARTGKLMWQVPNLFPKRCVASPIVTPGGVIVGQCGEGRAESFVYGVQPTSDGREAKRVYEIIRVGGYVPTPVAHGDFLFLWKEDGLVTCLRAATGEQVWSERLSGSGFYGSPIVAAGRLYNVTKRGELVVLSAGGKFQELARFATGGNSHATAAVAGGRLYLRTLKSLVSLGR